MSLRFPLRGTRQDSPSWLVLLFLLIGVIIPSASILWFINRAADSEAASARREVAEAYQGQLRLLRDRVDRYWKTRAEELSRAKSFQNIVTRQLADSAIELRPDGSVAYPIPLPPLVEQPPIPAGTARIFETAGRWKDAADLYGQFVQTTRDPILAARAAQAQVRCLLQSGDRESALSVIENFFSKRKAADTAGRSITGDEFLLAIKLLPAKDKRRQLFMDRLSRLLNDYEKNRMPSAQRLFLMTEAGLDFPFLQAERLAAQFLESDQPRAVGTGLRAANLPGISKLLSSNGRVLALFRDETVIKISRQVVEDFPEGVRFSAIPPGAAPGSGITVPAGFMLPGWQLGFSIADSASADAARRRRNTYLWTGYLVIASLVLTGLMLGHWLRRQMHLARLKSDLVATVSHELKTPLASIRLLVDSLLEGMHRDSPKTREYLSLIANENERLTHLVENFLTFSRIERRKLRFSFGHATPDAVVQAAVDAVRERFEQSGCTITVSIEPGLPPVYADTGALTTVLINLLDNAFKYTLQEKRIAICAFREAGQVVFAIADNGIGIDARDQKRIFQTFYRVDQSLARETSGVGLGLSIVESIVRAHGGAVRVSSTVGQGSTFSVILPST